MSGLYTALGVSPRKKRCPPDLGDDSVNTPKKLRIAQPTPPTSARKTGKSSPSPLPTSFSRLQTIQTALQNALSHALATCAVSPSSDSGLVLNVLNHLSLTTYTGLTTQFDINDLKRLCWLWEWDSVTLPDKTGKPKPDEIEDENPFLESKPSQPKDWTRGSMGLILSPTTHFLKSEAKRVPAYGIGIEVEMDLDKDMGGGMAAVARWTASGEKRRKQFRHKLDRWVELHNDVKPIPNVPLADIPPLTVAPKTSSLTRVLASASPKSSLRPSVPGLTPYPISYTISPVKRPGPSKDFSAPYPDTSPSKSPQTSIVPFPQTPSRRYGRSNSSVSLSTPRTPSTSFSSVTAPVSSIPSTPVHQRGADAITAPQTPSTSRRRALYERIRQRSVSASPTKAKPASNDVVGGKLTKDQLAKMGQEEMRRRCLLGRLGGVAESVWMLFSTPAGSVSIPTTRKRRALPTSEVILAVVKSSPIPISAAEANESLTMLTKLCPFFLKQLAISGEGWLEMPAVDEANAVKCPPSSPGPSRRRDQSAEEVRTRSPRTVKREVGGLRAVRETIRRELELQD